MSIAQDKMLNLRLLNVRSTQVPPTKPIWSLQTLIASFYRGTAKIWSMPQLRHVDVLGIASPRLSK